MACADGLREANDSRYNLSQLKWLGPIWNLVGRMTRIRKNSPRKLFSSLPTSRQTISSTFLARFLLEYGNQLPKRTISSQVYHQPHSYAPHMSHRSVLWPTQTTHPSFSTPPQHAVLPITAPPRLPLSAHAYGRQTAESVGKASTPAGCACVAPCTPAALTSTSYRPVPPHTLAARGARIRRRVAH